MSAVIILQVVLSVGLLLLLLWLKQLPEAMHKRQEQMLQQHLDRELETFRGALPWISKCSRSRIPISRRERRSSSSSLGNCRPRC